MRKVHFTSIAASILAIAVFRGDSGAAETCGNGLDDNSNGQADEGCYPTGTTGVCESPLSCGVAGAVSPDTGALVYRFAPDVTAEVAYGPSLGFQRVYTSQYNPGYVYPGASNYKQPLGYRMQHNYMSWLTLDTAPTPDVAVVHTVTGQDVLLTRVLRTR